MAATIALVSPAAASQLPPGFVRLAEVTPEVRQDIRYAGADNFARRPIAGYGAAECWLRRDAADAISRVSQDLARSGWRLVVYDCYRPERAVADFVAWARDLSDQARKAQHYPAVEKSRLFALGYIAARSGHSRGATVDVGADAAGRSVDFGTPFDFFDPRSATGARDVPAAASANRRRLVEAFAAHGFRNLAGEWWHFSLTAAAGAPSFDAPIVPQRWLSRPQSNRSPG